METMIPDNDNATYPAPGLWQKPDRGGTRYTTLKQWPANMAGQFVSFCGGVSEDNKYTYSILVNGSEGSPFEPFAIVAEWDILAGVVPETVATIADIVAKAVGYSARSILDPNGEHAA